MRLQPLSAILAGLGGLALAAACTSGAPDTGGPPPAHVEHADPPAPSSAGESTPGVAPGGSSSDEPSEPAVPYVHFDVNHVISTGQSNSVAHEGRPPLSLAQPFTNLMFDVGVMTSAGCESEGCRTYEKPRSFAPLVEGDRFWYPVETMSSGLANEAALLATTRFGKAAHDVLVSLAGRNGLTYWCLRQGGCNFLDPTYLNAFDENMMQVADGKAIAAGLGKSYVVRAVTAIHGESDDHGYSFGTPEVPLDGTDGAPGAITSYADALLEWQRDYEAGARAITGQTQPVPLLLVQLSNWNEASTSAVAQYQLEAHVRALGKVVVVTPAYILDFASDCRHYTARSERHLGEYFGKAYARIVLEGRRWEPVRPLEVARAGNTITARFAVPAPPLVLDTTRVADPGDYGFEVVDGAGARLAIASVALTAPDRVTVTLGAPVPAVARLRYAFTSIPHTCSGALLGPRGNLRDSDATPSQYGYELFNWSVHFDVPVP
jgi:hypothetical protein